MSFVACGHNYFRYENHQWAILVTVRDCLSARVIYGSFVQHGGPVGLSCFRRGQLQNNHLNKSISGIQPLLKDELVKVFQTFVHHSWGYTDIEGFQHFPDSFQIAIHNVTAQLYYRPHNELDEGALQGFTVTRYRCILERFSSDIKVVFTPKPLHEFITIKFKLRSVSFSKLVKSECPSIQSRAEGNIAIGWVKLTRFALFLELVNGAYGV